MFTEQLKKLKEEDDRFGMDVNGANGHTVITFRTQHFNQWEMWTFLLRHMMNDEVVYNRLLQLAEQEDKFWDAYERLSNVGKCDTPGGMEYQRVVAEWFEADCPKNIDVFIGTQANIVPPFV